MGEAQQPAESEGEEMHIHIQSKVSDCSENEAKSEQEAQIEDSELERNESGEENPRKSSEFGDNLVKSGENVNIEETPLDNGREIENKDENGDRSTAESEEIQGEMEEKEEEEDEDAEKPQLQKEISSLNRVNQVDLEFSNEKGICENGTREGEGQMEGQIGNFDFDCWSDGADSGTEEEQNAFMNELEKFHMENNLEFKPPKFYGESLNLLKLWRQTTRYGCYEKVTSQKLWRQVGEAFNPPKTCTTVSWTFRGFYEKALLEYEKHKIMTGQLQAAMPELPMPPVGNEGPGSGRARRDAAARAMEGWHSQRVLGNGEIADAIIKDRSAPPFSKKDKFLKSSSSVKRKKPCTPDRNDNKLALIKFEKPQLDISIIDEGPPADWVKINVKKTKDCYEVYALVPGLLREEVQVKSDPSGRLVVSGEPEQPDNPWGVTPFKKVITLPSCIDPQNTSAVVTLHGQLFVRAPFPSTNARRK
ncbi:ARID/BRIGHT DNA-binding domain-containing protein [Rhynchospora pubera]|uniref:ARID/BRIGHT DNA-binding domain-containing protein n=1 Tax=Rhynchospora pubera TaxID=906938 RepID=A0AAV8CRQ5_9POAL|nr:ARID/BRIGHT DNA-binding domain-containing protein [Rhynchospora pubera]